MFKVIIAGSRDFKNYNLLKEKCDKIFSNIKQPIEIVSGCARGADTLGEKYAEEKGYPIKKFPADWDNLGKKAGILRNIEMGDYADALVIFIKNSSRGSTDMLNRARKKGLLIRTINIEELSNNIESD